MSNSTRRFKRNRAARATISPPLLNAIGAIDLKPGLHVILVDDSTGETLLTGTSPGELDAARAQGWNIPAAFGR